MPVRRKNAACVVVFFYAEIDNLAAILVAIATPSFRDFIDKSRLKGVADGVVSVNNDARTASSRTLTASPGMSRSSSSAATSPRKRLHHASFGSAPRRVRTTFSTRRSYASSLSRMLTSRCFSSASSMMPRSNNECASATSWFSGYGRFA